MNTKRVPLDAHNRIGEVLSACFEANHPVMHDWATIGFYLKAATSPVEPDGGELLPCPFCGGLDVRMEDAGFNHFAVRCKDCLAQGKRDYDESAATAEWNRRAPAEDTRVDRLYDSAPCYPADMLRRNPNLLGEGAWVKWEDIDRIFKPSLAGLNPNHKAPVEDGELRELEREIALAYVSSYLEHECQSHEPEWANPIQHGDCCWTAKVIGWAESNGLLEHHLEDKNLVRVKSEQEGR